MPIVTVPLLTMQFHNYITMKLENNALLQLLSPKKYDSFLLSCDESSHSDGDNAADNSTSSNSHCPASGTHSSLDDIPIDDGSIFAGEFAPGQAGLEAQPLPLFWLLIPWMWDGPIYISANPQEG